MQFAPTSAGSKAAMLKVNAGGSTQDTALNGTGT